MRKLLLSLIIITLSQNHHSHAATLLNKAEAWLDNAYQKIKEPTEGLWKTIKQKSPKHFKNNKTTYKCLGGLGVELFIGCLVKAFSNTNINNPNTEWDFTNDSYNKPPYCNLNFKTNPEEFNYEIKPRNEYESGVCAARQSRLYCFVHAIATNLALHDIILCPKILNSLHLKEINFGDICQHNSNIIVRAFRSYAEEFKTYSTTNSSKIIIDNMLGKELSSDLDKWVLKNYDNNEKEYLKQRISDQLNRLNNQRLSLLLSKDGLVHGTGNMNLSGNELPLRPNRTQESVLEYLNQQSLNQRKSLTDELARILLESCNTDKRKDVLKNNKKADLGCCNLEVDGSKFLDHWYILTFNDFFPEFVNLYLRNITCINTIDLFDREIEVKETDLKSRIEITSTKINPNFLKKLQDHLQINNLGLAERTFLKRLKEGKPAAIVVQVPRHFICYEFIKPKDGCAQIFIRNSQPPHVREKYSGELVNDLEKLVNSL